MPGQPTSGGAQAVLIERIGNLQADITDIKTGLSCLNASQEKLERMYLVEHTKIVASTEAAHQAHRQERDPRSPIYRIR